uniref:GDSL esterase/lipase n=1 Tax=Oryza meridionalis TaxID=40149 RepID=A0A0E0FB66_9ORYZ
MLSTRLSPTSHTSCCDVDTTVGGLCLPTAQLCDDCTAFVFWDAYHTSDAANQVIADRLYADMVSAGAVQPCRGTGTPPPPRVVVDGGTPSTHAAPPPKP